MMSKKSSESIPLPKIKVDSDSGRKYVMVDNKRVWLGKNVTKKNLRKFLLKWRKKKKTTKKKTKKKSTRKKKDLIFRVFGENISRSVQGDLGYSLSAKALLAAQTKPSPGVDPDKIADKIETRIVAAMPSNAMIHMNQQKPSDVYVPEIGWVSDLVFANLRRVSDAADNAIGSANKKVSSAKRRTKIAELKVEIPEAKKTFMAAARKALDEARPKNVGLSIYLKRKLEIMDSIYPVVVKSMIY